jgi:carbon monoxide dehydrogenase subunit G
MKGDRGVINVEVSIVINRPLDEVFAILSDLENNLKWRSGMIEAKKTSAGPIGVGTTYRMINNVLGLRIEGEVEVTEYEPNRKYATVNKSGAPIETRRTFEPLEGRTRVTFIVKAELGGVIKLAQPLVASMAKRRVESDAANLKDLMEAHAL